MKLQIGNPYKLVVRHQVDGGPSVEKEMHERFAKLRMRGERFRPGKDLLRLTGAPPDDDGVHGHARLRAQRCCDMVG